MRCPGTRQVKVPMRGFQPSVIKKYAKLSILLQILQALLLITFPITFLTYYSLESKHSYVETLQWHIPVLMLCLL